MHPDSDGEKSSSESSVTPVVLPPKKRSRESSWLMPELKNAGGSRGVGGGRPEGAICVQGEVLFGTKNAVLTWKNKEKEI